MWIYAYSPPYVFVSWRSSKRREKFPREDNQLIDFQGMAQNLPYVFKTEFIIFLVGGVFCNMFAVDSERL